MDIRGKVAVVTGASSGIGRAVALELARRGAVVVGVARRQERLAEVMRSCQAHSADSYAHPGDVSSREVCDAVAADADERLGRIDILVNNAGISGREDPIHRTVADVEEMMAVNFLGPVYLTGAVLPGMVERKHGFIVNVTSVAGYIPNPGEPAYGATKAALSRWSHGLAVDLHGTGVHVGVLSPGPIDTEIWPADDSEPAYKGRLYPPETVATGAARMIERELTHLTVPRIYGAMGVMYPMAGRPLRWGLRRYAAQSSGGQAPPQS